MTLTERKLRKNQQDDRRFCRIARELIEDNMKDYTVIKSKVNISKGRSDDFYDKVQELSDFIQDLDLEIISHCKLIAIVLAQIDVAERDAFKFGFNMATKLMRDTTVAKMSEMIEAWMDSTGGESRDRVHHVEASRACHGLQADESL